MEKVILVNEKDVEIGIKEKMQAHKDADMHRAFSVLIFNSTGEMLIQQRAKKKYHCPLMWTNACCSHPMPKENTIDAAKRRVLEELGYKNMILDKKGEFIYKAKFENGLTEYEYDHVYFGYTDENPPKIDPNEIEGWKWINMAELKKDIAKNPDKYTIWFREIMKNSKLFP